MPQGEQERAIGVYVGDLCDAIEDQDVAAVFGLFSGGHDSVCSTHIASKLPRFKGVIHANTGIGIPKTREYVREVCKRFDWPLYERTPDRFTYRDLVKGTQGRERYFAGFPGGPSSHMRFYYYLKQRAIDGVVREHKRRRGDCVALVTGIRESESVRRMEGGFAERVERRGDKLWLNPILDFTDRDKNRYMANWELPRNEVVDILHRSGECLCGAFTSKDEFREIELWYPEIAAEIRRLEREVQEANPDLEVGRYWGRRGERENPAQTHFLPLCVGCEARS